MSYDRYLFIKICPKVKAVVQAYNRLQQDFPSNILHICTVGRTYFRNEFVAHAFLRRAGVLILLFAIFLSPGINRGVFCIEHLVSRNPATQRKGSGAATEAAVMGRILVFAAGSQTEDSP